MASNPSICGICSLRQITKVCKYWCPGCEEGICDECKEHHKLLKATRSHEPIPISNYKSLPSFITGIQQSCVYHNEQYQQYCAEHALPICFKCINDHRKCNVTTLEKVTNDFKTSEQFLDLESRLDDLLENIDRIKKDRHSNMTNIEEMKMRLGKEIRQKRVEINKHLDNLEKQLIKDLEEKECQSKDSIQKVLSSVTEKETMIIFSEKSLITIASNNKLKHKMPLGPSYGFDITLIDETTVAITDGKSGQNFGIDIIDIKNQRKIKFIKLPGRTWGITRDHNSLFVCVEGLGIYKVNTSDYATTHVISCNLPTSSYVSVFLDKIYYTTIKIIM
ncbi:Hypothetical predicted protein [Mytilus galloprovincialis]|uniref:B box-type domain-containing protein n=1 Tax=Mytilus galloprovincialis TaxID=29158 RepID=A0A8B6DY19_MYTGA|nr:Hypothetical predicted protein [Mytilus galloprovincialis]